MTSWFVGLIAQNNLYSSTFLSQNDDKAGGSFYGPDNGGELMLGHEQKDPDERNAWTEARTSHARMG